MTLAIGATVEAAAVGRGLGVLVKDGFVVETRLDGDFPAAGAGVVVFLAGLGLATDGKAGRLLRRGRAGEAVTPPPPRPLVAGLPDFPAAGDILAGVVPPCCFSDLVDALEDVRINGSRLGGDAAGFFGRLEAAAGVRLADGSLAENCERAGVVAFLSEGGEEEGTGDSSTRCTYCGPAGRQLNCNTWT